MSLQLHSFVFNDFSENTYIISTDGGNCLLIDPGMGIQEEEMEFFSYLDAYDLNPTAVYLTHTHLDHILGMNSIERQLDITAFGHRLDKENFQLAPMAAKRWGVSFTPCMEPLWVLEHGTQIMLGQHLIEVRYTPGHSPGHVVFYIPDLKAVIAGDTLFRGGIGRTDLPGGNYATLEHSIRTQLYTLPDDTTVYSGHGEPTSIGREKKENGFIREHGY